MLIINRSINIRDVGAGRKGACDPPLSKWGGGDMIWLETFAGRAMGEKQIEVFLFI